LDLLMRTVSSANSNDASGVGSLPSEAYAGSIFVNMGERIQRSRRSMRRSGALDESSGDIGNGQRRTGAT
jgi:hypothetical protein